MRPVDNAERYQANRIKYFAKVALARAVASGAVVKLDRCEFCGAGPTEGHHYRGYARIYWLVVWWLCRSCHQTVHRRGQHRRRFRETLTRWRSRVRAVVLRRTASLLIAVAMGGGAPMKHADALRLGEGDYVVYKFDRIAPERNKVGEYITTPDGKTVERQVRRRVTKYWVSKDRSSVRVRVHGVAGFTWIGLDDWAHWKDPLRDPSPYVFERDVAEVVA